METKGNQSSEQNQNFQAPKRGEVPPSLQPPVQEHQTQTQEEKPVTRRRGGSREGTRQKPLERTPEGELYVGSLIRKARQEKGLTMKEAAARVGYGISGLSQVETNHETPSEDKLQKIAEVLDVPIEELHQAYQHPRTIHRTPPEQSKRLQTHLQGKPLTEFDKQVYYRPNVKWKPDRFRQVR